MKVLVIGAGPAGLTAAINAAKRGADVVVIEHQNKTGKKLSVTGNGKCNITNMDMNSEHFYCDNAFINSVINQFNQQDTISFFDEMGIYTEDKNGYIYPMCEQASFVSNRLKDYASNLGVKIKMNNQITSINKITDGFEVDFGIKDIFDNIIIATGGKSFANTGSDGSGYELAQKLGHSIVKPQPALTALICNENHLSKASGVRVNAEITLDDTYKEIGQLQITDYGISGIPVFNLSRNAKENSKISIDFLPKYDHKDSVRLIEAVDESGMFNVYDALCGVFNDKLASVFLDSCNMSKTERPSKNSRAFLISTIKNYKLIVKERKGFEFAQVTAGGVDINEINPHTMESKLVPGLYFAGEIMDVDGKCGGYNLQFAWSSGTIAGRNVC